jgi:hypothetical protein
MKTSHKAVLTFAITAISTFSGGTLGSRIQALLEEANVPATSITDKELSPPVRFQSLNPKRSKSNPETGKYSPGLKKYTIVPVADALSLPIW